jgi:hypothetical protein
MNEYYVYVYLNPLKQDNYQYGKFHFDYEPFYIGMGKNDRINQHILESKYEKKKTAKHYKILKILKEGLEPIRYKLYENITKESANRLEYYLINLIGRKDTGYGPLCNLCVGGSGSNAMKEIAIIKIKKTIGNTRKGELNPNYGNTWSDEQKEKANKRQIENHKHLCGENNPSKGEDIRKRISESKLGMNNPNACLWELISPKDEKFLIYGSIKKQLLKYNLSYSKMCWKIKDKYYYNKDGWKMHKIEK